MKIISWKSQRLLEYDILNKIPGAYSTKQIINCHETYSVNNASRMNILKEYQSNDVN